MHELQVQREKISLDKLNHQYEKLLKKGKELQQFKVVLEAYNDKETNLIQWQTQQEQEALTIKELVLAAEHHKNEHQQSLVLCDEAKRALVLIQEAVTKGAASLRSLLQENQACPVCGSLAHPWAEQDSILNQQYHQQKERVNELESIVQTKFIELNHLSQKIEYKKLEQSNRDKQIKQTVIELKELTEQWTLVPTQTACSMTINNNENKACLDSEIEKNDSAVELNKELLGQVILLQKNIDNQQQLIKQLQNEEKEIAGIISEQEILSTSIKHITTDLEVKQAQLNKVRLELEGLNVERQALLNKLFNDLIIKQGSEINDDISIDELENSLLDSISTLTELHEGESKALEQTKKNKIKIDEQCHYLQQQIDDNSKKYVRYENKLMLELNHHELERV